MLHPCATGGSYLAGCEARPSQPRSHERAGGHAESAGAGRAIKGAVSRAGGGIRSAHFLAASALHPRVGENALRAASIPLLTVPGPRLSPPARLSTSWPLVLVVIVLGLGAAGCGSSSSSSSSGQSAAPS